MERTLSILIAVFRTVLIQRAVMERTISIWRAVFRRTVLIQRAVVERTVQKMVSYIAQMCTA